MSAPGQVFTPADTARRIVLEQGILDAWLGGASVLDPTAGNGSFIEALVGLAVERGVAVMGAAIQRLFAVERDPALLTDLATRLQDRFGMAMPAGQLLLGDIFSLRAGPVVDILVGNPPWVNYVDLEDSERTTLRPLFRASGLVADARRLLLGGARIDVAALVIAHTIRHHLKPGGKAVFLAPLSLYLNDGAHQGFRRQVVEGVPYALREVYDHRGAPIFPNVSTRYGLLVYTRDERTRWPVPWHVFEDGRWVTREAAPSMGDDGPLAVHEAGSRPTRGEGAPPPVPVWRPRQGVNACGASGLFVFDRLTADGESVEVENSTVGTVRLPRRYVFPLMTTETLRRGDRRPHRWILVPHDPVSGQPLERSAIDGEPELARYLDTHASRLRARKGTLLGNQLRRGRWWALLGVGAYTFSPYRVAWEALGRASFRPVLLGATDLGPWQGNQALHAYIPVRDPEEGARVLHALSPEVVEPMLRAHRMEGTCNWAQPGRIARILAATAWSVGNPSVLGRAFEFRYRHDPDLHSGRPLRL